MILKVFNCDCCLIGSFAVIYVLTWNWKFHCFIKKAEVQY